MHSLHAILENRADPLADALALIFQSSGSQTLFRGTLEFLGPFFGVPRPSPQGSARVPDRSRSRPKQGWLYSDKMVWAPACSINVSIPEYPFGRAIVDFKSHFGPSGFHEGFRGPRPGVTRNPSYLGGVPRVHSFLRGVPQKKSLRTTVPEELSSRERSQRPSREVVVPGQSPGRYTNGRRGHDWHGTFGSIGSADPEEGAPIRGRIC